MTILTVGQGRQYATIAAAVAASRDGDTVQVQAGTYVNDFVTVNTKITITAIGGMAHILATVPPPNGKGIIVTNTDVTLDHLELSGAAVADGNGAGVRYQGGALVMTDCHVHDNENGILANPVADGRITIRDSEFAHNGSGDGHTHNIYVGRIAQLTIEDSYIHDAVVGHEIKSRADATIITGNRIVDGPTGTASYSIDLPNGGKALIQDNLIEQGPRSENPAIVHFGGEGYDYPGSSLVITGNTVVNDLPSGSARLLLNHTATAASIDDNAVWGLSSGQIASGPAKLGSNPLLALAPAIDTTAPWAAEAAGRRLVGTAGADTLTGSAGNDTIRPGAGWDALTGGDGADRFVFTARTDRLDRITDFDAAEGDRLDLSQVFAGGPHPASLAGLQNQGFVLLIESRHGVRVKVDADGGGDAFAGIVRLEGETIASLGDHFLIA
jgi:Ca2+-binding RTX toxin-like protein